MILRIIITVALVGFGYYCVKKPDSAYEIFGRMEFAEKLFTGGTRSAIPVLGVILILLGFSVITCVWENLAKVLVDLMFPAR